jgi:hypothetical protein
MIHGVVIGAATATTPQSKAPPFRVSGAGRRFRFSQKRRFPGGKLGADPCDRFSARTRVLALIT